MDSGVRNNFNPTQSDWQLLRTNYVKSNGKSVIYYLLFFCFYLSFYVLRGARRTKKTLSEFITLTCPCKLAQHLSEWFKLRDPRECSNQEIGAKHRQATKIKINFYSLARYFYFFFYCSSICSINLSNSNLSFVASMSVLFFILLGLIRQVFAVRSFRIVYMYCYLGSCA